MTPLPFVAWRAGIGAAVLVGVVVWSVRNGRSLVAPWALPRTQAATFGVAAAAALVLNLAMFTAFDRVTVAVALIGFYTYPAMVAVVAVALGRERPSRPILLALALALGGMVVVVAGGLDPATGLVLDGLGILLALLAAAAQTTFVTISRDGYPRLPADQAMAWILAASAAGCAILALAGGTLDGLLLPVRDPSLLPLLLSVGVLGAGIPSLLFLVGIRRIGGTRAGIVMLLEPVVGVGLAALLLGESLRPVQAIGAAAVLGAALLLRRATREPALPHETEPSATAAGQGRFAGQ
jgi:DME family drug/metabolite transporter